MFFYYGVDCDYQRILTRRDFMTKKDMLLLISVNDEINRIYDGIGEIFGDVSTNNLPFQQFTDMILDYTHSGDEVTHEKMWEILIDRNVSVEERYERMGFDFLDVPR